MGHMGIILSAEDDSLASDDLVLYPTSLK